MEGRRKLREKYRGLIADSRNCNSTGLQDRMYKLLKESNELHKNVTKPREHAVDTELLHSIATNGLSSAKMSMGKCLNTPKDVIYGLKSKYSINWNPHNSEGDDGTSFCWKKFGEFASEYFNTVTGVTCAFGPLQGLVPVVRKAHQRRERMKLGALVNPDEVKDASVCCTEKQETDKNMEEMHSVLKLNRIVPLGAMIMNHQSFAQTVENIFTLSFLVKDGRAILKEGNKAGEIMVCDIQQQDAVLDKNSEARQFVASFSVRDWNRMKSSVSPAECLIKHREHSEEAKIENAEQDLPETPNTNNKKRQRLLQDSYHANKKNKNCSNFSANPQNTVKVAS